LILKSVPSPKTSHEADLEPFAHAEVAGTVVHARRAGGVVGDAANQVAHEAEEQRREHRRNTGSYRRTEEYCV